MTHLLLHKTPNLVSSEPGAAHFRGSRAEFYGHHDRGLHRGWYKERGDRTVVIKKQRRHWDD